MSMVNIEAGSIRRIHSSIGPIHSDDLPPLPIDRGVIPVKTIGLQMLVGPIDQFGLHECTIIGDQRRWLTTNEILQCSSPIED